MNRFKLFLVFAISVFPCAIFTQTKVIAEKEKITTLNLDASVSGLSYVYMEDGFYSPNGPMVDNNGLLLFYPTAGTGRYDHLIQIEYNGIVGKRALYPIMKEWRGATQLQFASQQGYIQLNNVFIDPSFGDFGTTFYPHAAIEIPSSRETRYYPLPFGSYMESIRPPFVYSTELLKDRAIKVRDLEDSQAWLSSQSGGFAIGKDGLLYRGGIVWSAVQPKDGSPAGKYLGKTLSGHNIWTDSTNPGFDRYFTLSNSQGKTELVVEIPWGRKDNSANYDQFNFFNYGIGPWGEIYCLIAPKPTIIGGWPIWEEGEAELVVIRNHLKYFGRLNDGGVRLRKEPSTSAESLGTYSAKTGFRILEKGTKEETLAGQKNVWYKVRLLDGKEGWFFGAFVHNLYDGPNGKPPPWPNVPDW